MPGGVIVGEPDVPKFDSEEMAKKAIIAMLFGVLSPHHEEQLQSDRGLKDEIDRRGGYENLGEGERGKPHIRHLDGGNAEAEALFEHLTGKRGGPPQAKKAGDGHIIIRRGTDADGNEITYRSGSTGNRGESGYTGSPTVDVHEPGKRTKLRFGGD